ncbi:MAG: tetratricopeptide repeat protein [Blastocatellia bacterium]|nr:tetratricopeptide repeat protein [Blastocatellia bacterium]
MLFEAENLEKYKDLSPAKADECVKKNPKSVDAFIVRSKLFALKGDFDLALADANKAIELSPQSSDAFYARGFVYDKKYRVDYDKSIKPLAMADYEKALKLNPKNGVALLEKTVLTRNEMGNGFQKLLPDFNLAMEYLTASGSIWHLARAYYERGSANGLAQKFDDAISDYTEALKLRPNYWSALVLRGTYHSIRTDKPNLDAAIADYSEYLKVKPSAYTFAVRAAIYERKGETAKAIADYRSALAIEPDNYNAKEGLARLAPANQSTATKQNPPTASTQKTAEQFAAEGRQHLAAKDYWNALESFTQCLLLAPNVAACHSFRGFAAGMLGDLPTAEEHFKDAIRLEPNQAAHYFIRGMMYSELGKKDEAIRDLRAALKLNPNYQQAKAALQKLGVQP